MKRTIVCTLLALSISSSLYSPQIVLAAEQTEETLTEHSNTGATDTIQNTKSATAPKEDTITKTEEQAPVSITVNENLDVLKQKLKNPFKEEVSSGRYLLTEDLIFIGYLDSSRGEEGFLIPSINQTADKVSDISFGEYNSDGVFTWGYINTNDSLSDIKSLSEYIKKHTGEIQTASSKDLISFPLRTESPTTVLVFSTQGDYLGNMDVNSQEAANTLYDDTFLETPSISISSSLADDKTQANVSVAYDFSKYPEQLGGEYLMNFDIKDSKGNLVLSSDEALKKYIDTGNTVKGVTRVFPISIEGVTAPKQEEISTAKPDISYSELPNGILTGTNFPITVYSSIDSVLMLNGESSQTPCKEYTFSVSHNGKYKITATTSSGIEVSKTIEVTGFVDSVKDIDMNMYGTGGSTMLPQTGGVSWVVAVLSGVIFIIGGMSLVNRDRLFALLHTLRKKVSK